MGKDHGKKQREKYRERQEAAAAATAEQVSDY